MSWYLEHSFIREEGKVMWWCKLNVSFHVNTQRPIDSCFISSHSIIFNLTSRAGQESLFVTLFLIFESVDLRPKPTHPDQRCLSWLSKLLNFETFEYHPYQWSKWLSILANVAIFRQIVSTFRPLPAYFIFQKYCMLASGGIWKTLFYLSITLLQDFPFHTPVSYEKALRSFDKRTNLQDGILELWGNFF